MGRLREVCQCPRQLGLEGAPGVDMLPSGTALPDYSRDLVNYLVRVTAEARERRQRIIRGISTREQAVERQQAVVKELWAMLGGPLERGPLNPRVTGIVQRPGYRIEKVAFESRPRLYVTANLYVPDRPGRRPAILGPLGHSLTGKAWHTYQKLFSNLARKGYVVLAYDPFGQGERIEYPGAAAWPDRARRRRHGRARVRRTPAHSSRRELRVVSRVGRHSRARLPGDAA